MKKCYIHFTRHLSMKITLCIFLLLITASNLHGKSSKGPAAQQLSKFSSDQLKACFADKTICGTDDIYAGFPRSTRGNWSHVLSIGKFVAQRMICSRDGRFPQKSPAVATRISCWFDIGLSQTKVSATESYMLPITSTRMKLQPS